MKLVWGNVVNKSVDFGFYLSWLFLVGCDVERVRAQLSSSARALVKVEAVFKTKRMRARGRYFLVKLASGAKVGYGSLKLKVGDVILFAPYRSYVPRYLRSFDRALV